jgi:hypothetical protein
MFSPLTNIKCNDLPFPRVLPEFWLAKRKQQTETRQIASSSDPFDQSNRFRHHCLPNCPKRRTRSIPSSRINPRYVCSASNISSPSNTSKQRSPKLPFRRCYPIDRTRVALSIHVMMLVDKPNDGATAPAVHTRGWVLGCRDGWLVGASRGAFASVER